MVSGPTLGQAPGTNVGFVLGPSGTSMAQLNRVPRAAGIEAINQNTRSLSVPSSCFSCSLLFSA